MATDESKNIPPIDGTRTVKGIPPVTTVTVDSLPTDGSENQIYIDSSYSMKIYKDGAYHGLTSGGSTPTTYKTSSIKVSNTSSESISKTASTQYDINVENLQYYLETVSTWTSDRTYYKDKLVFYNGSFYISIQANNQGNIPSSTSTYWKRVNKWRYAQEFSTEQLQWIVDHNLGDEYPFVQCVITTKDSTSGTETKALTNTLDVKYISGNRIIIDFNVPVKGIVIVS